MPGVFVFVDRGHGEGHIVTVRGHGWGRNPGEAVPILRCKTAPGPRRGLLSAEGWYEKHLEPGKYTVYLPAADNVWRAIEIEIPDAPSYQLDLQAPAGD